MTYMIDWYRLQHEKARGLILILVMSKFPARITAGKMAELSMTCFSNVSKLIHNSLRDRAVTDSLRSQFSSFIRNVFF